MPRCGDPRPSPRDTPRQVRAADQVRGRAASALAQVAFCRGSLRCGGRSVHRRGRSGVPGLHLPGASSSPCPGRPPPGDLGASPPHMTAVSRRHPRSVPGVRVHLRLSAWPGGGEYCSARQKSSHPSGQDLSRQGDKLPRSEDTSAVRLREAQAWWRHPESTRLERRDFI